MQAYKINKGFITQKLGDKMVILDGEEMVLYTFNETASYIFSKIKTSWDEKKITDALIKKYGIKEKKARVDLDELINDLLAKKIITRIKQR